MKAIKMAENVYFCTAAVVLRTITSIRVHKILTTNVTFLVIYDISPCIPKIKQMPFSSVSASVIFVPLILRFLIFVFFRVNIYKQL
jgi:hypothetical protein